MGGTDQGVLIVASIYESRNQFLQLRAKNIQNCYFVIKARNLLGLLDHATNNNHFLDNKLLCCHFL